MGDGNVERVAEAVGSDLSPGESAGVTIDDSRQTHAGHTDSYEVHKDENGKVTADKWHHDDSGNWWQ